MARYVLHLHEVDKSSLFVAGGKGANLGELVKVGFPVPEGFCITTEAYSSLVKTSLEMEGFFELLSQMNAEGISKIREVGERIREHLNCLAIPAEIEENIIMAWRTAGEGYSYAVRSSATAEDLPTASFAGQQDTYLNVQGQADLLKAVRACWASLFTDRAIVYRCKNGFDHRKVALAVVVQRMVFSDVSGTMFTADPVTGNRWVISIDASFGLGEALVSGIVSPDLYQVKYGQTIKKQIASKEVAVYSLPTGGTGRIELDAEKKAAQALTDEQILQLANFGEQIQRHYGTPQDIEWALCDGEFYILQSRPITSLYPFPKRLLARNLDALASFGHLQMMTDALRPLAVSAWRTLLPVGKPGSVRTEGDALVEVGGRLYVNYSPLLRFKKVREKIPQGFKAADALIGSALGKLIERNSALAESKADWRIKRALVQFAAPVVWNIIKDLLYRDLDKSVDKSNAFIEKMAGSWEEKLRGASGATRIRLMQESMGTLMVAALKGFAHYAFAGMAALGLMSQLSQKWLGDKQEIPILNKSLTGNVTTEMGLQLGDLADVARDYPEVIDYLQRASDEGFYQGLAQVAGGDVFGQALAKFMDKYGMRCPGEIDLTRQRWQDTPSQLMPIILGNVQNISPGEHRDKFKEGEQEAELAAQTLVDRVKKQPGGWLKGKIMARLLYVFRNTAGLREHPKYALIRHYDIFRRAVLEEGQTLAAKGTLKETEDTFHLTFTELAEVLEGSFTGDVQEVVARRREEFAYYQKLTPPRVMTGEGEVITGSFSSEGAPVGALLGNPVSAGIAEGRACIVMNPAEAKLQKGDILVAPYTDPGWTPLFLSIGGVVTEVGGLMTHGAVVAREYGIPAVVGMENATKLIKEGQIIRIDGNRGYVEILKSQASDYEQA